MTDRAVPVLVTPDLARAQKFWRYFDFAPVLQQDGRLRLQRESVAFEYSLGAAPIVDGIVQGVLCVILVDDVYAWHDRFSGTRMRWKAFGGPSLTSIARNAWGVPAFCVTDYDHNLIWIVQDRARECPDGGHGDPGAELRSD